MNAEALVSNILESQRTFDQSILSAPRNSHSSVYTSCNLHGSTCRYSNGPVELCNRSNCKKKMEAQPLVSLTSIDIHESEPKVFDDHEAFISLLSEHDVETSRGKLRVTRQGKEGKTAIVTFHDIGQNHTSAFLGFFNFNETRPLLDHFCIYHIDAPGQQEDSEDLPVEYLYPTMDELSDMVGEVVNFFDIKRFIGFGIGAGANILCRYALWNPTRVEALVLVELVASNGGWIEWGYQKVSLRLHVRARSVKTGYILLVSVQIRYLI